jgi:hypothetical protein
MTKRVSNGRSVIKWTHPELLLELLTHHLEL